MVGGFSEVDFNCDGGLRRSRDVGLWLGAGTDRAQACRRAFGLLSVSSADSSPGRW